MGAGFFGGGAFPQAKSMTRSKRFIGGTSYDLFLSKNFSILVTIARRVRFDETRPDPIELAPSVTLRPKHGLAMRVVILRGG
jgi:hypothetical protein